MKTYWIMALAALFLLISILSAPRHHRHPVNLTAGIDDGTSAGIDDGTSTGIITGAER